MAEKFIVRKVRAETKTCPACKKKFTAQLVQRYCSPQCRKRANYARHAEEYRQGRRESYLRLKKRAVKGKR